jgi:hypothetical protein
MNRRQLLTLAALALPAAALVELSPLGQLPVELSALGKLFRAAPQGTILVSADEGKTWSTHTRFGADFAVTNLGLDSKGRVSARLAYQGHPFHLALAGNGKTWLTA